MHLTDESNQKPRNLVWWLLSEFNIHSNDNNVNIGLESPFPNEVKIMRGLGRWLQRLRVLATQSWGREFKSPAVMLTTTPGGWGNGSTGKAPKPEDLFDPQKPHKGGRREPIPQS